MSNELEKGSGMERYELKNWEIRLRGQWPAAYGNVYGNPKFRDGHWIHTSSLMGYELHGDILELYTCHSSYYCRLGNFNPASSWETLERFLRTCRRAGCTGDHIVEKIREAVAGKAKEPEREETLSIPGDDRIILSLDAAREDYFAEVSARGGGRSYRTKSHLVQHAKRQDIVLVGIACGYSADRLVQEVNFAYFPFPGNRIQFRDWPTGKLPVYLHNDGGEEMEFNTPYGDFVVPGGTFIRPESADGALRATHHIAPKTSFGSRPAEHHVTKEQSGGIYFSQDTRVITERDRQQA